MIANIENAMIEAIKGFQNSGSVPYKTKVETYGGEFAQALDRAVVNFPAILIIFSGARVSKSGQGYKTLCRFLVICAASNLRNETSSRHGDGLKPGSYQMAIDVLKILGGQSLGLDIDALNPLEIRPLINDRAGQDLVSVYSVVFECAFYLSAFPEFDSLDDFLVFHPNWDVPVFGNVDENIPSDETADATDHVTLQQ